MPLWILPVIQAAAAAMLRPLLETVIKSIFDTKNVLKIFLALLDMLVKSTATTIDDDWAAGVRRVAEAEIERLTKSK